MKNQDVVGYSHNIPDFATGFYSRNACNDYHETVNPKHPLSQAMEILEELESESQKMERYLERKRMDLRQSAQRYTTDTSLPISQENKIENIMRKLKADATSILEENATFKRQTISILKKNNDLIDMCMEAGIFKHLSEEKCNINDAFPMERLLRRRNESSNIKEVQTSRYLGDEEKVPLFKCDETEKLILSERPTFEESEAWKHIQAIKIDIQLLSKKIDNLFSSKNNQTFQTKKLNHNEQNIDEICPKSELDPMLTNNSQQRGYNKSANVHQNSAKAKLNNNVQFQLTRPAIKSRSSISQESSKSTLSLEKDVNDVKKRSSNLNSNESLPRSVASNASHKTYVIERSKNSIYNFLEEMQESKEENYRRVGQSENGTNKTALKTKNLGFDEVGQLKSNGFSEPGFNSPEKPVKTHFKGAESLQDILTSDTNFIEKLKRKSYINK